MLEETGLRVGWAGWSGTVERDAPGGGVYVIRDYVCRPAAGRRRGRRTRRGRRRRRRLVHRPRGPRARLLPGPGRGAHRLGRPARDLTLARQPSDHTTLQPAAGNSGAVTAPDLTEVVDMAAVTRARHHGRVQAGHYLHWGVISISVANAAGHRGDAGDVRARAGRCRSRTPATADPSGRRRRTGHDRPGSRSVGAAASRPAGAGPSGCATGSTGLVPPGEALPDRQPAYVASWIYVFGVLTLAALVVVLGSGGVLALGGAAWWHVSSLGHFVNSLHLWSVELFFAFMVIHLWGKFWMAAWRGRRGADLGDRRGRVRDLDRDGLHRLPLPVQLRLAVDRRRGARTASTRSASAPGSTC